MLVMTTFFFTTDFERNLYISYRFNVESAKDKGWMQLTVLLMFYLPQLFKTQEEISAVKKQLKKEEMALGRHEEKLVMFLILRVHQSSYYGDVTCYSDLDNTV